MRFWVVLTLLAFFSSVPAFQSPTKERIYLELGDTRVTENGETIIEVGGKCGPGEVIAFHLPGKGWFIVSSVKPSGGYGLRKIGKLDGNRITFEVNDRRYEIISDKPISPQATSLDLWAINITSWTPKAQADADSKSISCATDFKYWLKTTLFKDESVVIKKWTVKQDSRAVLLPSRSDLLGRYQQEGHTKRNSTPRGHLQGCRFMVGVFTNSEEYKFRFARQ